MRMGSNSRCSGFAGTISIEGFPVNTHSPGYDAGGANGLPTAAPGSCSGRGNSVARGASNWLSLMAAPTFAFRALLTAFGSRGEMLCSAGHVVSPLTGMVAMYALMSVFHSAPWLKLVFAAGRGKS